MSEAYSIPCGYGNKIVMGNSVMYTSEFAVQADLQTLYKMFDVSVTMLSKLLDLPIEDIVSDMYDMSGCNLWLESINAVMEKSGKKHCDIPTITEMACNYIMELLKDHKDQLEDPVWWHNTYKKLYGFHTNDNE